MTHPTLDLFAALQAALAPQYRLERELGRGGMGVVFLATDATLDRRVAVKVIHPELAAHPSIARRFLAEARTIARVRHPGIVAVHSAGTHEGLLYYVMDEVAGESLRQRLAREGHLPPAEVARIVGDLASALDAAGRAGVVHRDVKPENVLLDESTGRAMLADFGIARAMVVETEAASTGQGVAVGTPSYMSPEQAAGEEIDGRSDLYALGVVAYEMLAGQPPFVGTNRVVVSRHIAERPTPIDRVRPDCPRPLAAAIMKALEKQPADRWQTGDEFRHALTAERGARPRGRRGLAAAAAVVLAVAGGTVGLLGRGDGPPAGTNPRHSMLVLPFDNLRDDRSTDWIREGSVSMLGLNLSQWNDLTVVDHERLHDLLARRELDPGRDIGLEMARRLARDAGVWTVVLGDFTQAGDSLHLVARVYDVATGERVDVARVDDRAGEDIRPLFDELAAKLLDLSGAPTEVRIGLVRSTTQSLEAYRAYLSGVEQLNRWDLAGAERELGRALAIDTTFGLAYYKLALTRGWLVGTNDSIADHAIVRATAHSSNLPAHDRTVISAYRAFIGGEFTDARALYQQLLARDPSDADAWYGLGEAWFHDTTGTDQAPAWTKALQAFKRSLALDPEYALAYDHVQTMLASAAGRRPTYAMVGADSFALARAGGPEGGMLLDSTALEGAVRRARTEALSTARSWVASQPATLRAHGAMVDAYLASGNYNAALSEVNRFRQTSPVHPELPFVEAKIRFASGDVAKAADQLRTALDTMAPQDFRPYQGAPTVVYDIAAAANVFAYQGDLANAAKALDLADQVRREVVHHHEPEATSPFDESWRRVVLGELYAAMGVPASSLRQVWQSAAEAGRMAPAEKRVHLAHSGASAAIGLFTGPTADSTAIAEYRAMTGDRLSKEVRALLALTRGDSTGARLALAEPDTLDRKQMMYGLYRRPLAAQAYYLLGDYQTTLRVLQDFEPATLRTAGFDSRWGMLGRVRLLRAAAYEQLGRRAEAREEYRQVLAQWTAADTALQPFIRQAEQGLARVGEGV
jgi:serine/threonine-protein kinase